MESAGPDWRPAAQPALHAALELGGGVLSESNSQNLFRPRMPVLDQPGNALHQHRGLAGAGAGQHQHGTQGMLDGSLLLRVGNEFVGHKLLYGIMRK